MSQQDKGILTLPDVEISEEEAQVLLKYIGKLTMYDVEPSESKPVFSLYAKVSNALRGPLCH